MVLLVLLVRVTLISKSRKYMNGFKGNLAHQRHQKHHPRRGVAVLLILDEDLLPSAILIEPLVGIFEVFLDRK